MTQQLRAKLLPHRSSKTACRKLPPLKSSLKDGLRSVFPILQDSEVKGQCALILLLQLEAWGSPELFLMHTDITKSAETGGGSFPWIFFPLLVQGFGIYPVLTEGIGVSDDSTTSAAAVESWTATEGAIKSERKKNPHLNTFIWSWLHYDLCSLLIRFSYW